MRHELNFWVVGGDMRQAKLAEQLSETATRYIPMPWTGRRSLCLTHRTAWRTPFWPTV